MDKNFIEKQVAAIRAQVGDKKVLLGLSGGVDSSVCAALIHKAIGGNLICVFVNHGLLRKGEFEQVQQVFRDQFGMNLIAVDAEDRFLDKLKGVSDPEKKRKIIGEEFVRVFEEEAKKLGKVEFLAQGTILPDIIESGTDGKNKLVKSHHNVGGLPADIGFEGLVEPVRDLYKFEVREVGRALGLPDFIVDRQPFPGPGLGVRCIGEITREKLAILRDADFIFREEIEKAGLGTKVWQYFAIINDSLSTLRHHHQTPCHHRVGMRQHMPERPQTTSGIFVCVSAKRMARLRRRSTAGLGPHYPGQTCHTAARAAQKRRSRERRFSLFDSCILSRSAFCPIRHTEMRDTKRVLSRECHPLFTPSPKMTEMRSRG